MVASTASLSIKSFGGTAEINSLIRLSTVFAIT